MLWTDDETRKIKQQTRFNKYVFGVFCIATVIGIVLSVWQ